MRPDGKVTGRYRSMQLGISLLFDPSNGATELAGMTQREASMRAEIIQLRAMLDDVRCVSGDRGELMLLKKPALAALMRRMCVSIGSGSTKREMVERVIDSGKDWRCFM